MRHRVRNGEVPAARALGVLAACALGLGAACTPAPAGTDDGGAGADAPVATDVADVAPADGVGDLPPVDARAEADGGCVPACDGRDCGDDGCGGTCGPCVEKYGFACVEGACTCQETDRYACNDRERWLYPACGQAEASMVETCPYGCADGACHDCVPSCGTWVCGSDGCGGSCGTCDEGFECESGRCYRTCGARDCGGDDLGHLCGQCAEGVACNAGWCGLTCATPPVPSGPAGRLVRLWMPSTVEEIDALCPDLTADGAGDNGIRGLAGQLNGALQALADAGAVALVLEPAEGGATTPRLVLLRTSPVAGDPAGALAVDPATFDPRTCEAPSFLPVADDGATLREAGAGTLTVSFPATIDHAFDFRLQDLRLRAPRTPDGVPLALGPSAVAGVATREELERMLTWRDEFCALLDGDAYRRQGCGISTMVGPGYWFDLARNADGTWRKRAKDDPRDGGSVCLAFEAVGTVLASP